MSKTRTKERSIMLTLRVESDAFQGGYARGEIAEILQEVACRIQNGHELPLSLMDCDGNRVGEICGTIPE